MAHLSKVLLVGAAAAILVATNETSSRVLAMADETEESLQPSTAVTGEEVSGDEGDEDEDEGDEEMETGEEGEKTDDDEEGEEEEEETEYETGQMPSVDDVDIYQPPPAQATEKKGRDVGSMVGTGIAGLGIGAGAATAVGIVKGRQHQKMMKEKEQALDDVTASLDSQLRLAGDLRNQVSAKSEELERQAQAMKQLEKQAQMVKQLEAECTKLRNKSAEMEQQIQSADNRLKDAEQQYGRLSSQYKTVEDEKKIATEAAESAKQQLQKVESDLDRIVGSGHISARAFANLAKPRRRAYHTRQVKSALKGGVGLQHEAGQKGYTIARPSAALTRAVRNALDAADLVAESSSKHGAELEAEVKQAIQVVLPKTTFTRMVGTGGVQQGVMKQVGGKLKVQGGSQVSPDEAYDGMTQALAASLLAARRSRH